MSTFYVLLFSSLLAQAAEPGLLRNEKPAPPIPSTATPMAKEDVITQMNMRREFEQAKGPTSGDLLAMHYNRVGCARRIFSEAGWSVEGDGDLKVTRITSDLYEAEFPSYLALAEFDPYQSGFDRVETAVSRQLVDFRHWVDGRTLKIFKSVTLSYMDPNKPKQTAYAMDEFRVIEDSYPPTYIVRETISAQKRYVFYYVCQ